ncbi:MAG: ankyrin repeat domain-containing protein [Verrucomicrobia bacterium]|nr:ankyrin repeat domain-containing protein [Verrucomicrobiota bacterium]
MHFPKSSPLWLLLLLAPLAAAEKNILFIAGPKSHDAGQHEHPASCELLAKHLASSGLDLKVEVSNGWPQDAAKVLAADTIVIYGDGMGQQPANGHLPELRQHFAAGKGLVVLHWALEPGDPALAKLLDEALGGRFEMEWSVNPIWKMTSPIIAKHPVTRGVAPFEVEDEFYYHLRFRDNITPLLQALPPVDSLGADGPRSGNPAVRKALADKVPQTLAWVVENPNQARGFGFTGGHYFRLWALKDFRQLVLNGIVWSAGLEIPPQGVAGKVAATPAYQTIDEAIAHGDLEDVRLHLAANPPSLHQGSDKTRSPLAQAVLRNKTEIALLLLESGAKSDRRDASQRTVLHLAVERANLVLVNALMKSGAKPDLRDKDGWTPLHHAAAKNQLEIAKALLNGGANPMTLSELGGTPLHEAAASGGAEMVQLLLDHKVDPTVKSTQGVTALDIAKKYNNQSAVGILSKL